MPNFSVITLKSGQYICQGMTGKQMFAVPINSTARTFVRRQVLFAEVFPYAPDDLEAYEVALPIQSVEELNHLEEQADALVRMSSA